MNWTSPPKPAELTENRLIDAILNGHFAIGSNLPSERELANQLGITRPTLREALQRLARDGWLEIHQGKPTRIRDYWHEGNLGVLGAIANHSESLPQDFVPNLLYVRQLLAPNYARLAIEREPENVVNVLEGYAHLHDAPQDFASFDWRLHHQLTILSGNPIFTLILNGFCDLYQPMACRYFESIRSRLSSRTFYARLYSAAQTHDPDTAEEITFKVMKESLSLWYTAIKGG